ncbi:tubulin-specific chaperone D-like isoform X2 [Hyperolius riggenbachi]|uniref:tubulin-specific chaperone D-like isoform X2 n=1 Tax=Hyperolius riggenbachi TaxID=752182 RepID=UPI0035A3CEF2
MSCMEPVSREVRTQRFKGWMLELLLEIIQDKSSSPDFFHLTFKFLFIISKVTLTRKMSCLCWSLYILRKHLLLRRLHFKFLLKIRSNLKDMS